MTTIINNPGTGESAESGAVGVIVGALLVIVVLVLFFVYGLPMIRGTDKAATDDTVNVNVQLPSASNGQESSE